MTRDKRLSFDFWKFWTGQTISNLGSSFTMFALPLLIYKLTGSALNLGIATAAEFLPYLLFGLIIGAWVDRLNRKRLMILTDILRSLVIALIPFLAQIHHLSVWWIYAVGFVGSTLTIFFNTAEFAAIPSLAPGDDLVTANGRIQASYAAASVLGPVLAGVLVAVMPVHMLLLVNSATFILSAVSLALVRTGFNLEEKRVRTRIRDDMAEGLRYVLGHPVLRNISIMMALVNFVSNATGSQLVFFAKHHLAATDSQVALLFSASSVGVVVISLMAGLLRRRWSFSRVALTALALSGLLNLAFSLNPWYPASLLLLALAGGLGSLFNINTGSLRQVIVPNHMLGRVISIASVLAWSPIPLGSFLGGLAIQRTGNVVMVFAVVSVITFLIPVGFSFTALGHADRYIPELTDQKDQPEQIEATAS